MHIGSSRAMETHFVRIPGCDCVLIEFISVLISALVGSVILAIITYETYEKWYLKLSSTNVGLVVTALFFMNVVLIKRYEISDYINNVGPSFDNITRHMTLSESATR